MDISDDAARSGAPARTTGPLSDAAIAEIALLIRAAAHLPPPDDYTTWILSAKAELSPVDEGRVITALDRLRAAASELPS